MKKTLLLSGMLIFIASNVFAAATTYDQGSVPTGLTGFTSSKSVRIAHESTATTGVYFASSAKHINGNKIYGAVSTQTSVYSKDGTQGTALVAGDNPTLPTTVNEAIDTSWTSM